MAADRITSIGRGLMEASARALAGLSALGMTAIVCLIAASVVTRKLFNAPLNFSEEVVGLLMSASVFLALPMVTLQGKHVRVSIVASHFGERNKTVDAVFCSLAALVGVVCCTWLTVEAVPWLEFAVNLNLKTETARVLLYPWMAALPISVALTGTIFAVQLIEGLRRLIGRRQVETGS